MKSIKKLSVLVLTLVLGLFALVSCGGEQAPSGAELAAKKIILTQDKSDTVTGDFNVPAKVVGDDKVTYSVTWTSSNTVASVGSITEDGNFYPITVNYVSNFDSDQAVKLSAKLENPDKTDSYVKEFNFSVPKFKVTSIGEYDAADGGTVVTMQGIIVAREPFSAQYNNVSIYLQDISGVGGIYAYRLKCTQEQYDEELAIGNTIVVTGEKALYNGLREFSSAGCTYRLVSSEKVTPKDTDVTSMITDGTGISLDYQNQLVHFSDLTVVAVGDKDSSGRWNITVGDATDPKKQIDVRINTYITPKDGEVYNAYVALGITKGAVISVSGVVGWYNTAQINPLYADSIKVISEGEEPEPEPEGEKFTGVVTTSIEGNSSYLAATVQNASGESIYLYYKPSSVADALPAWKEKVVVGKKITISNAKIEQYKGLNEFVIQSLEDVEVVGDGILPSFTNINSLVGNTDELAKIQGKLVKVSGEVVVDGTSYYVKVADGKQILVYGNKSLYDAKLTDLVAGETVTVYGFLNWFDNPQVTPIDENWLNTVQSVLASSEFDGKVTGDFTYISNNEQYPDPSFYSDGGLKFNFENMGLKSAKFAASTKVDVTIVIYALNENTKTAASANCFTVYGYNAAGEQVAVATFTSVVVGFNTVTLEGEGIVSVKIMMTGYPNNGTKCCNVSVGGALVTLKELAAGATDPTEPEGPTEPQLDEFSGIVTLSVKNTSSKYFFALVQNANGEAKYVVYTPEKFDDAAETAWFAIFTTGNSVTVKGKITTVTSTGVIQFTLEKLENASTEGTGDVPAHEDISSKVEAGDDLNSLQGKLVKVTGYYTSTRKIEVSTGKGITIYFNTNVYDGVLDIGAKYTISGYLTWYKEPEIVPMSESDIVLLEEAPDGSIVLQYDKSLGTDGQYFTADTGASVDITSYLTDSTDLTVTAVKLDTSKSGNWFRLNPNGDLHFYGSSAGGASVVITAAAGKKIASITITFNTSQNSNKCDVVVGDSTTTVGDNSETYTQDINSNTLTIKNNSTSQFIVKSISVVLVDAE